MAGGSSKSESYQELRIWIGKVVNTLDGPIWSRCSIALTYPARSHFQRTLSKERWSPRVGVNVIAHQEDEKKEEKKTCKRRALKDKKRKQATNYVGVNISLNNSSSLSSLNVYASSIRSSPTDVRIDSFSPSIFFSPEISLFWGTSIAITPFGAQEVLPTRAGRKYSTGSTLITSSPSMTLTHLPFSITSLAVAPLLPFLCSWELLQNLSSDHQPIFYPPHSLRSFAPMRLLLPSIFRKLAGMTLPPTLTPTVFLQRNTRLFLFPLLLLLSFPFWH